MIRTNLAGVTIVGMSPLALNLPAVSWLHASQLLEVGADA